MNHAQPNLPLKTATRRVAGELEGLHARLERLEYGLDMVFLHSSEGINGQSIQMLQELDVLRQSLGALSDFLTHLSNETNSNGDVDPAAALNAVPLRDMAIRLEGRSKRAETSGVPDLF